jgi:hypothetical protein
MKTGGMTLVTYDVIGEQEWEDMAPTAERSASEWDRLLDDLEQGKIISMPYTDLSDRRSKRMTVARRALSRGFKTEVRYTDSIMAIRRSGDAAPSSPATPRQPRRRRTAAQGR